MNKLSQRITDLFRRHLSQRPPQRRRHVRTDIPPPLFYPYLSPKVLRRLDPEKKTVSRVPLKGRVGLTVHLVQTATDLSLRRHGRVPHLERAPGTAPPSLGLVGSLFGRFGPN